ncbi:extracellular solute-binding protein [Paenibacillus qinlingensis]|uniref:Aldouronate transport system substrate-binding protein n=1 Tax=Paenibacillus qinlingensis TaxID=1837343 RepID=A0ABU1P011_9BACL|nr:extracellular solute-binding protein [Paenibacillus qinlingensis]MDR6553058.1 putative aldouronate transport system substrate-binding protein [Paenibacillus qinlingensis]
MRKRNWMASTMAVVLSIGVIGCSNTTDTKPAESAKPAAETPKAQQGPTKFSISMRTLNFDYVEKAANLNDDKWVKELEKKTNTDLDIQLVPHAEFEKKMVQMFATGDIPDVVQAGAGTSGKELAGSVQAGIFLELNDLIKQHAPNLMKVIPQAAWDEVTLNGKIYAIPEFISQPSRRATWVREDLMKKAGITKDPKTVDEYLEMLRAFKKIGVEHPFMGRQDFKYADIFFGSYDVYPYSSQYEVVDGKVQPKFFDTENMQKALTTYKTMFDEGLINKEFATINPTNFKNLILAGKAGMWEMNAQELIQWETQLKATVPDAKIKIIPSPVGTDSKGGGYLYSSGARAYFINSKINKDKIPGILKFFEWQVSEEADKWFDTTLPINPKTDAEVSEQRYLSGFLHMVKDDAYRKQILNATPEGQSLLKTFETILPNEGRGGLEFDTALPAMVKNPDIASLSDTAAPVLIGHMVKMVYGKEPISDWPKVIEEWKSKGGNDALKEANDVYQKKNGYKLRGPEAQRWKQ